MNSARHRNGGFRSARRFFWLHYAVGVILVFGGCGLPWDPAGTLGNVRGNVLRVGVSHNPPWTDITTEGDPTGREAELVLRIARELDARIEWHPGGEMGLLTRLENFELDLVIGGLTEDSPWKGRVGFTRPHAKEGKQRYVLAVPPGENGWIVFLDGQLKIIEREQKPEGRP